MRLMSRCLVQIEFHFGRIYGTNASEVLSILKQLEAAGLRVFSFECAFLQLNNQRGALDYGGCNPMAFCIMMQLHPNFKQVPCVVFLL